MPSNRLRKPKTQKYKAAMAVSDLIHSVRSNSLAALQKDIQMMKIYRPQSIFSVRSEIRRKISNFIHFDFALGGFNFPIQGIRNRSPAPPADLVRPTGSGTSKRCTLRFYLCYLYFQQDKLPLKTKIYPFL